MASDSTSAQPNPNWFSFGPFFGLDISARFKDLPPLNAHGGAGNGGYQDGYVLQDSSGDQGGKTWNWGYDHASQVQGNTLTLHGASATTVNSDSLKKDDGPELGFDLAYGRDLGHLLGGKWGVQAAFDFTDISIDDNQPFTGRKTMITDTYSLGGIIPPEAPYTGSFNGPGPLISDTPIHSVLGNQTILLMGQRTLDAQIYVLRLGPYYERAFWKRLGGRVGGGVSLALADTKLSYSSGPLVGSASSQGEEFKAGGYVEGLLLFSVTRHVGLFAGAQYEYLGTYSRSAGTETAELDLTGAIYLLVGAQWRF